MSERRVGIGYDVHPLKWNRDMYLGGVKIVARAPDKEGLDGHSDADVLIHAICDALLGAMGENDIGHHFPDSDEQYRDIRSTILLQRVRGMVEAAGYRPVNVDCMIVAQEPRLSPYFPEMKKLLGDILGLKAGGIGIKATTPEGVDGLGAKRAITAMAVCLIETA